MNKYLNVFLIISGLLISLFLAFVFTPVTNIGDATDYINYALKISGEQIEQNFINRPPLYPLVLAGLIKIVGISDLPRIVIIIQFLLNFFSALLLFAVLKQIMSSNLSLLSALLFYFNLSCLFYGYMILTETLTVFIFMISVYLLTLWVVRISNLHLVLLGIVLSFLILVRFNTLPLIFAFMLLIIYNIIRKESNFNFKRLTRQTLILIIPIIIILNLYALHNLRHNNFYGIFSAGGSPLISRNAILATIEGNEEITAENKEVYGIFLEARNNYYSHQAVGEKGSLLEYFGNTYIKKLYSGFQIYLTALPQLRELEVTYPDNSEIALSNHLKSFYKEVRSQNKVQVWRMRLYSLLNSFRASSGITIPGRENLNLNILPGWSVIAYKIVILLINLLTFVLSIALIFYNFIGKRDPDPYLTSLILLYLSFYLINFVFGTMGDANRFKYPADPLVFGLFVYYLKMLVDFAKKGNRVLSSN